MNWFTHTFYICPRIPTEFCQHGVRSIQQNVGLQTESKELENLDHWMRPLMLVVKLLWQNHATLQLSYKQNRMIKMATNIGKNCGASIASLN